MESVKRTGETAIATNANCQSIHAVTQIIPINVSVADTNGMKPSTVRYCKAIASFWIR